MHEPSILWIDLRVRRNQLRLPKAFRERCRVRVAGNAGPDEAANGFRPDALCFDFDYPDLHSLRLLQDTKRTRPSLPLIMLTEQHSEALAVWAFRTRVWDYLVKPVIDGEANRAVDGLISLTSCDRDRRQLAENPAPPIPKEVRFPGAAPESHSVSRAITFVQQNLGSKIKEQEVAELCNLSAFRFSRAFKKEMGITFQEYVIRERITESCRLMQNPNASITDIAYTVGFNDPSYFARMFKRYLGRSPSAYRQADLPGQPDDPSLWARLELPAEQMND